MEEENSTKIEGMEIVQEKMQERLDQVLEMMANLVKEKGATDSPSSQKGSIPQEAGHSREDLLFLQVLLPRKRTLLTGHTCP